MVEDDNGEAVVVGPFPDETNKTAMTDKQFRAFRSAFGGWADLDTDKLKQDIYKSRQ